MVVKKILFKYLLVIFITSFTIVGCLDSYKNLKVSYSEKELNENIKNDTLRIKTINFEGIAYGLLVGKIEDYNPISEVNIGLDITFNEKTSLSLDSVIFIDSLRNKYRPTLYVNKTRIETKAVILEPNIVNNIIVHLSSEKSKIYLPLTLKLNEFRIINSKLKYSFDPLLFEYQ